MKKIYTTLIFIITLTISAQAPQGFNYQATVRNNAGALMVNQNVTFKFNVIKDTPTSVPIFSETHYVPTDDLGAVNLVIGKGTPTTGTFATIDWATGTYYLGIELNTGNGFKAMGTSQLLSVPYALYAKSSGSTNKKSKTSIFLSGNITDSQAAIQLANELGPDTENIYIRNTTQLTNVDLSSMVNAVKISIQDNEALTNVNLNSLTTIFDGIYVQNNSVLNLSCPMLKDCFGIEINNIPSLNLSALTHSYFLTFSNITNFNPPSNLISCNNLSISNLNIINTINFPSLIKGNIDIFENRLLTSISFPALINSSRIRLNQNALTTNTINSLLNKFLTVLPLTNKNIELDLQSPSAPPTGQGIIDRQTLRNTSNYVTTD